MLLTMAEMMVSQLMQRLEKVGHVDHGADASDCNICTRFVSVGYVHTVLRTRSEVFGVLFVNHGGFLLGEE